MVGSRLVFLGYALNSQADYADCADYDDYTVNHRRKQGVCQNTSGLPMVLKPLSP
jgi:hypothetical protein